MRIGLVASRLHRDGPDAALIKLMAPLESALRDRLRPGIVVVGQTYDALSKAANGVRHSRESSEAVDNRTQLLGRPEQASRFATSTVVSLVAR